MMPRRTLRSPLLATLLLLILPAGASAGEEVPVPPNEDATRSPNGEAPRTELPVRGLVTRPILAGSGALLTTSAALYQLRAGDSLRAGDPLYPLLGTGAVALVGAVVGSLTRLITPQPFVPVRDRISAPTLALSVSLGGGGAVGESEPAALGLRWSPAVRIRGAGLHWTLRPAGSLDGALSDEVQVDPSPQAEILRSGEGGGFPTALVKRPLRFVQNLELIAAPGRYPARRPRLGWIDGRLKLEIQLRHQVFDPGGDDRRRLQHLALPLLAGLRWHLAARQRFTVFLGPRLEWIGFAEPSADRIQWPTSPTAAYAHGEAWYHIDIPLTPRGRGPAEVTGRAALGYVHSNLDGRALDFGAVVGFFGPLRLGFDLRVRPRRAPWAVQLGLRAALGAGLNLGLEAGVALPEPRLGATGQEAER
jgi:hypothetical protein